MMRRVKTKWHVALTTALLLALGLGLNGQADAAKAKEWISAWGFSQQGLAPETVTNGTVRMIARTTISGSAVRVVLQNTFGLEAVTFDAAYVGQRANVAILVPGSNHQLTFGDPPSLSVTIPPGEQVTSNQVPLNVEAFQDLAVSLYVPGAAVPISRHTNARTTSFLSPSTMPGNHAAEEGNANFPTTSFTTSMWWLAAIDVFSSAEGAIVNFGDSITDGTGTTLDGYDRWHDFLALRLQLESKSKESKEQATVNEGIGGNRINVYDPPAGQGPAALLRLDRDVLGRAGVTHVIFFEGTNDLAGGATSAQVIAGSEEIIQRVKDAGLKIIGVTMIPRHNAAWTAQMTQYRNEVNDWIRNDADFDAVIDFDKVVGDPGNPDLINPIYDLADHIHPNPLGYFVMGKSIDLSLFDDDD
jgi:lysophospholipase L1-like esterase